MIKKHNSDPFLAQALAMLVIMLVIMLVMFAIGSEPANLDHLIAAR